MWSGKGRRPFGPPAGPVRGASHPKGSTVRATPRRKHGDRVLRPEPGGPAESRGDREAEEERQRAEDPEGEEPGALGGPAQRPGEGARVRRAAGAPGRAPERLVDVDRGPLPRRAAAPQAPASGSRESERAGVEPVRQHEQDAEPERGPRTEGLPREEPQDQGDGQEEQDTGDADRSRVTAITDAPRGQERPVWPRARART